MDAKTACENGVEYINNEVTDIFIDEGQIQSITLRSGEKITANNIVKAAGTRAAHVAWLAGVKLPIEALRRYTYIFSVDDPLPQDLPLTIDPSGVHLRSYTANDYLVGCPPIGPDVAVDVNDFSFAENGWEEKILPIISHRIPQFATAQVTNSWMGHYEFNTFDHNAIVGPHNRVHNPLLLRWLFRPWKPASTGVWACSARINCLRFIQSAGSWCTFLYNGLQRVAP